MVGGEVLPAIETKTVPTKPTALASEFGWQKEFNINKLIVGSTKSWCRDNKGVGGR